MLEQIKHEIGALDSYFDIEVNELIEAAKIDLKISGVVKVDEEDSLIRRAISLYCRINFRGGTEDTERLERSYTSLVTHLALCNDYNGGVIVEN